MFKRIFLVGFRATGKSTAGKILAEKLGWSFFDLDFLITQQAGEEVNIITNNGRDWLRFRQLENEILKEISEMENVVISCGGGIGVSDILDKKTNQTFGELNKIILNNSKDSVVILLTADDETIIERLVK